MYAALCAEKTALENQYQLFCSQKEDEKSQLQSQVIKMIINAMKDAFSFVIN